MQKQKGNIFVIGIIVLALVLGGYFVFKNKGENLKIENEKVVAGMPVLGEEGKGVVEQKVMEDGTIISGSYEAYAPEKLALALDGKVILFFHASWCPTCRAADSDINKNLSEIPDGVHILKIDYDSNTALKQKYGVTYQHTFVQVDSSGNLIKKWTGSSTLAEIVANIK